RLVTWWVGVDHEQKVRHDRTNPGRCWRCRRAVRLRSRRRFPQQTRQSEELKMSAMNKLADSVVDRIEHTTALDRFATPLASAVSDLFGRSGLKDVFSGSWFGHPLHPLLTDLPIGSWTSAMVLEFVRGRHDR